MLGWEFPPAIAGGLGIASAEIAKSLSTKVDLQLLTPAWEGLPALDYVHGVGDSQMELYPESYPGGILNSEAEAGIEVEEGLEIEAQILPRQVEAPPVVYQRAYDYAEAVVEKAAEETFDIIHVHDWLTALPGLALQEATGKPLVLHVHALEYDRSGPDARGWVYSLEREALERADLIIPVSTYMAAVLIEHYEIDSQKIQAVPHGGPEIKAYTRKNRLGGPLVVFAGRLAGQKNPFQVLNLAEAMIEDYPSLNFILAGDGPDAEALMEETLKRGLEMHVLFTGFLGKEALYDLYAMADVFFMPSWSEPFGLAAVEAAAFGLPCMLSDRCGAVEILRSALLTAPDDTERQAALLRDLLENETKRQWLGENMQVEATSFSWEDAGDSIVALYKSLTIS